MRQEGQHHHFRGGRLERTGYLIHPSWDFFISQWTTYTKSYPIYYVRAVRVGS